MKKEKDRFKELRRQYPKKMSKEQFYQVAHISRATALFLLQSGLVPCSDTGKKTRRYTIKTEDVIKYLTDREIHPEFYKAKRGWYSGTAGDKRRLAENVDPKLLPEQRVLLVQYLLEQMDSYEDLMTVKQLAEFTGYNTSTIINWCNKSLKHFNVSGRFLIPKISVVEYLASSKLCLLPQKSRRHKQLLKVFLIINKIDV